MLRQDILWTLETDYRGNSYYVSGNALLHALAHRDKIDYHEQQALSVSHGMFCPSVYGVFPEWHSQSGGRMSFASTLKPIERYADLFLFRLPYHPWMHDGRPRDAVNTPHYRESREHDLMTPHQAIQVSDGKPRKSQWYIHCYLTQDDGADILPLPESAFDGLQVGGRRNYGFGRVNHKDSAMVDVHALEYDRLEESDGHVLELVTPYVIASEFDDEDGREDVPYWWDANVDYRLREDAIVHQNQRYALEVCDHGQVTRYEGGSPVQTAKNGVARVGRHKKYGFGELMVRPA